MSSFQQQKHSLFIQWQKKVQEISKSTKINESTETVTEKDLMVRNKTMVSTNSTSIQHYTGRSRLNNKTKLYFFKNQSNNLGILKKNLFFRDSVIVRIQNNLW